MYLMPKLRDGWEALQRVIEQRINALGVSEPNVYSVTGLGIGDNPSTHRLVVELPGVTDTEEATRAIGETPYLEFKILDIENNAFIDTELQGTHITSSEVQFLPGIGGTLTNEPVVVVHFNRKGGKIFADLTKENVGNILSIFLDGSLLSTPRINEPITGGTTQIQGNFTLESAKELVDGLNLGALPLPIELSETLTVSPVSRHGNSGEEHYYRANCVDSDRTTLFDRVSLCRCYCGTGTCSVLCYCIDNIQRSADRTDCGRAVRFYYVYRICR